jgi:hypothetical protein
MAKLVNQNINMKIRILLFLAVALLAAEVSSAKNTNLYPIAVLRNGNVWVLKNRGVWQQLTTTGDAKSLCWLDKETICYARGLKSGLKDRPDWQGLEVYYDLFTVKKGGGIFSQFTMNHFATEPAKGNIPGRALFTHIVLDRTEPADVWETILPTFRDRYLGIRGHQPDASPDQHWIAATMGVESEGIVLHNYPDASSYRKMPGSYSRPRFSPDSRQLAYLNHDPAKGGVYVLDMPDGDSRWIMPVPAGFRSIEDFGWSSDGTGFILLLLDNSGKKDLYFHEIGAKTEVRLTETGDVERATGWH